MARPAAIPPVQIDTASLRVTEWRFPPGAVTGWHRHALDCVVVPMTTGRLLLEEPAGVEHDVVNNSDTDFVFIEIEPRESGASELWTGCLYIDHNLINLCAISLSSARLCPRFPR